MTYEQMEKTMQFILDQQAVVTTRHSEFDDWRKQVAAENTEQDRQFDDWRKQVAAESAERNRQIDQRFDQMIAASTVQNNQIHEALEKIHKDLATLAADSDWHKSSISEQEKLMNQLVEQVNRLTETVDRLALQNISLGDKIEVLAETVKNLIKGGSNGWPRN